MEERKGEGRATRPAIEAAAKDGLARAKDLMPLRENARQLGGFGRRQHADTARGSIGGPIGRWAYRNTKEGAVADLLNILPDIEERLLMRVEVGAWVGLREEIET